MNESTARSIVRRAKRHKHIQAVIAPRGTAFVIRATLHAQIIGSRIIDIHSEKQWKSLLHAWRGL